MSRLISASLLLALSAAMARAQAGAVAPWPKDPDVRLSAQTVLDATRFTGAWRAPIERTDVRQRLALDLYLRRLPPRVTFVVDLELGSDFGPEPDAFAASPDGRRAVVDLYAAHLDVRGLGGRLDLTLGRQLLYDVLGADALDGLTMRLRAAPFLRVGLGGGLAARRRWSSFGPDVFEPDGGRLSDEAGVLVRGRLATTGLRWLQATAGYTRHFDAAVQREEAAAAARIGPSALGADLGLRWDTLMARASDARLGLSGRLGELGYGARWRQRRPLFSADSIWNAFSAEPWQAWELEASWTRGAWALEGDAGWRTYDSGAAAAQTPGLEAPTAAPAAPEATAGEGGLRLRRRIAARLPGAHLGIEGRLAEGYGGARRYGDVFARLPLLTRLGLAPMWLRARLGAVWFDAGGEPDEVLALSGWGLLAAEWAPEETIRLEVVSELFSREGGETRGRVMARLRLEDWW